MRILIVGPSVKRTKGGMATVISDQLNNPIINKAHKLSYLVSHVEGSIFEKAYYSIKGILYILFNQQKFDIIHFHTAADASFYRKSLLLRVCKLFNKKTILHIHGADFDSFYLNNKPALKKYIKSSLYKSNTILVLSDYWKSFFTKEFLNLHVEVLQNGIEVEAYKSCINNSTRFNKFLFLGRLGERKGVYDLLKAIDIVVNSRGKKELKFYLAGDGETDKVMKVISDTNLTENVQLLGWLNDAEKKEILKQVEVVVLPSYDEGLPMALIEAMACGKIIISTYAGGIPNLVSHNYNGFLFPAGKVDELVKYLLYVNENPAEMGKIQNNNIKKVYEHFNLASVSNKLNAIYYSLR